MRTNQEYKNAALAALRGNWAPAVLATVAVSAISLLFAGPTVWQSIRMQQTIAQINPGDIMSMMDAYRSSTGLSSLQTLAEIFIVFPMTIGFTNAFRLLLETGDNRLTLNTFNIGFSQYLHKVWGYFLMIIFIFLWSLLLLIPGIVKAFSYAMTPYILEEHPELSASEAIDRSRAMMKGHKFDLFWLYLGFLGWFLLCLLTCGIGFLWLEPYVETSKAAFYQDLKESFGDGFDAEIKVAEVL